MEADREVWAIELKASRQAHPSDLRGLRSFADFAGKKHRSLLLYLGNEPRRIDGLMATALTYILFFVAIPLWGLV